MNLALTSTDAAGICIKSGNACILRGGSESLHSSQAIAVAAWGLKQAGFLKIVCR